MFHYEYVSKKQAAPYKIRLIEIIKQVQNELLDDFTFQYRFIGSSSRNMITRDPKQNIGFDFDVDLAVNDKEGEYCPIQIRTKLFDAFTRISRKYGFNESNNSTRVFTIKEVDCFLSRINWSCDFAVIYESDEGQQYIRLNKTTGVYTWEFQGQPYRDLKSRADFLSKNGHWGEVRDVYLEKKNNNANPDKHSRSLYAETINECYSRHGNRR